MLGVGQTVSSAHPLDIGFLGRRWQVKREGIVQVARALEWSAASGVRRAAEPGFARREPAPPREARSVRAAGAAAGGAFGRFALVHLEGVAAAARRGDVRVRDLETRLLDRLEVVDLGALQIRRAVRI